jgi:hypothetical protein
MDWTDWKDNHSHRAYKKDNISHYPRCGIGNGSRVVTGGQGMLTVLMRWSDLVHMLAKLDWSRPASDHSNHEGKVRIMVVLKLGNMVHVLQIRVATVESLWGTKLVLLTQWSALRPRAIPVTIGTNNNTGVTGTG